eukprot:CAMPEP_0197919246 /NCGR_PEP_ID=MMETSP1439-20131203/86899_1 /TAXON_ID=66791 /ORGANISM="Gonyaulax spinifera, Strain CCMP409" /LENGTH=38 /DNA_ID= /DNA_START= /DNA_END= /DNA_ORIENTATION=
MGAGLPVDPPSGLALLRAEGGRYRFQDPRTWHKGQYRA